MEQPLFPAELIPQQISSTLPKGYTLRPLQSGDYDRGVLEVLSVLTSVGEISKPKYLGIHSLILGLT
jgi:glucosamine-phosphate N-acetyltransferase